LIGRLTFRTKLLLSHVGLVAAVVLLVSALLERSLAADLEAQQSRRILEQARGATEWVSTGRHPQKVAGRLAAIVQAEVTIFDDRGCIVGTSAGEQDALDPDGRCVPPAEVAEARSAGVGRATRPSEHDRIHYVAVPADDGVVIRLAVSSREIEAPAAAMRRRLAVAAIVAAAAALVLGLFASRVASRPLRTMAQQAGRIAQGDYDVRFPELAPDEFGHLADTLAALARQLRADMERIGKLEVTRRDFVANVTHELRTPVAAMQGCAETLLAGGVDPERAAKFLEMMHKHAQRISGLVDGLLALADLEAAAPMAPAREPVTVLAAARDAVETLRGRAADRRATIHIDVAHDCVALGDPVRVDQVLENLVDNAIKHGAEGGTVRIEGRREGDAAVVRVIDDGPGIDAVHLDRVFERFYRVDAGRSREAGGAGLGLAIVKHLVESMGGTITAASEPGRGATFTVRLEAAPRG
jgi:signal transduction histidine kinase